MVETVIVANKLDDLAVQFSFQDTICNQPNTTAGGTKIVSNMQAVIREMKNGMDFVTYLMVLLDTNQLLKTHQ